MIIPKACGAVYRPLSAISIGPITKRKVAYTVIGALSAAFPYNPFSLSASPTLLERSFVAISGVSLAWGVDFIVSKVKSYRLKCNLLSKMAALKSKYRKTGSIISNFTQPELQQAYRRALQRFYQHNRLGEVAAALKVKSLSELSEPILDFFKKGCCVGEFVMLMKIYREKQQIASSEICKSLILEDLFYAHMLFFLELVLSVPVVVSPKRCFSIFSDLSRYITSFNAVSQSRVKGCASLFILIPSELSMFEKNPHTGHIIYLDWSKQCYRFYDGNDCVDVGITGFYEFSSKAQMLLNLKHYLAAVYQHDILISFEPASLINLSCSE